MAYKTLKNKGPYILGNKVNRSSTSTIPEGFELKKSHYNKRLAKISDRQVPRIINI